MATMSQEQARVKLLTRINTLEKEVTSEVFTKQEGGVLSFTITSNWKQAPNALDSRSYVGMISPRGKVVFFLEGE